MTKSAILTDQVKAEVQAALDHFGANEVQIGTRDNDTGLRIFWKRKKAKKGDKREYVAPVNDIDFRAFERTQHYARAKHLRKVVGRALADLMEQGVDIRAMNEAA